MPDPARRLVGAVVGGVIGFALTYVLTRFFGVTLLAAAGGGVAIGAGSRSLPRSLPWAIGITGLATAVAIVTAWHFSPFTANGSLGYFVANLAQTNGATKIGILITVVLGGLYGGGTGSARPPAYANDQPGA